MSTEAAVIEILRRRRRDERFDDEGWCSFPLVFRLVESELGRRPANSTVLRALGRLTRIGHLERRPGDGPGRVAWWRWRGAAS